MQKTGQDAIVKHKTTAAQENGKIPTGDPRPVSAEPSFTPGPWEVHQTVFADTDDGLKSKTIVGQRAGHAEHPLASVFIGQWRDNWSDGEANAQLIAAAPEMYAALENTVNNFPKFNRDAFPNIAAMLDQCRAALAKARGQS